MSDKTAADLKAFIERVNKKNPKHNGKKVRFSWNKKKGQII